MHKENIFLINSTLESVCFTRIKSTLTFNVAEFVKKALNFRRLDSRTIEQQSLLDYLVYCRERALTNPKLVNYKESYVRFQRHKLN